MATGNDSLRYRVSSCKELDNALYKEGAEERPIVCMDLYTKRSIIMR